MPVTEDVATSPAVMTANKVVECAFASWVVADGGFGIGLFRKHVLAVFVAIYSWGITGTWHCMTCRDLACRESHGSGEG